MSHAEHSRTRTVEILELGRERVREGWCQDNFAEDKHGTTCLVGAPEASAWCAVGAIGAPGQVGWANAWHALTLAVNRPGYTTNPVLSWNDEPQRTQEEVVDLYDRAIKEVQV